MNSEVSWTTLFFSLVFGLYSVLSHAEVDKEGYIIVKNRSNRAFRVYVDGAYSGTVTAKGELKIRAKKGKHRVSVEGEGRLEESDINLIGKTAQYTIVPYPKVPERPENLRSTAGVLYIENKKSFSLAVYLKGKGRTGIILSPGEKRKLYLKPGKYSFEFKNAENELVYRKTVSVSLGKEHYIIVK